MSFRKEAIEEAGFPEAFSYLTSTVVAEMFDCVVQVRGGTPPAICTKAAVTAQHETITEFAAKPVLMKTKTSLPDGPQFLRGLIAWDQELLGREGSKPIPENSFKPIQLAVTLREILIGVENNHYEIIDIVNDDIIFITPHADTEEKRNTRYILNLSNGHKDRRRLNEELRHELQPWETQKEPKIPDFWKSTWGNFQESLNNFYPVSYIRPSGRNPQPLEVAADLQNKPITGDIDLFAITIPFNKINNDDSYHTLFNSASPEQLEQLYILSFILCSAHQLDDISLSNGKFLENSGILTPYELTIIKTINYNVNAITSSVITDLIQHGPETNNPGQPSSLEDKIFHIFPNGNFLITRTEDELVGLMLRLKTQYIRINPNWNMEKWAPVIKQQLKYHFPVSPKTLEKYQAYLRSLPDGEEGLKYPKLSESLTHQINEIQSDVPTLFIYPDELYPSTIEKKEALSPWDIIKKGGYLIRQTFFSSTNQPESNPKNQYYSQRHS